MKFSVIIPAYNREEELPKCIESVLNQTYTNFELIIVDNGSTDNTKELIRNYMKLDNRIKYFWQENSGSPAGSRNTGIQKALGEWIAFLDSDDYWYKHKLDFVDKEIEENENIIAVSHYENKEINGFTVGLYENGKNLSSKPYFELLFNGNSLSTSAMTVKKNKLLEVGLFDTRKDYFAVEDYDMWMRLAKVGEFAYIKQSLGFFCISHTNMSGNIEMINDNLKTLMFNHIDLLNIKNKDKLKRQHGARVEYYRGRTYQLNGDFDKAIPILKKSVQGYPWSLKKYIALIYAFLQINK
jgi:glycosyltransferase involved in cell wall biosynthesis